MSQPGRKWTFSDYRYSHNGQEKEDAVFVGAQSAEYWMYDSRIGRRWNIDPVTYPWQSPYACFNGNPIYFADARGLKGDPKTKKGDGDGNKGDGGKKSGGGNSGETITKNPDGSSSSSITWEGGGSCTVYTPGGTDGNANNNKVTLDAGHGDNNSGNKQNDPGAVDGTHYEKDYAAWLEQETYSALKFMGVDAQRTRSWDINVDPNGPINWRWKLANANGSDVFISFHLNNGNDNKAFAVYCLNYI